MKKTAFFLTLLLSVLFSANTAQSLDCTGGDVVRVDQEHNAGQWNLLGTYEFASGSTATVTLTRENDGDSTCADAVRIVNTQTGAEMIVDNNDGGCVKTGKWINSDGKPGWNPNKNKFANKTSLYSSENGATATWTFSVPAAATYNVYASWTNAGDRAGDAPYCITGFGAQVIAITASAGPGGTISPDGYKEWTENATPAYTIEPTITPDATHTIEDVLVDGASVLADLVFNGKTATYTFPALSQSHDIEAIFEDHGDNCDAVTEISCPSETDGKIHENSDYDYFSFTLSERMSVIIQTKGDTNTYGYLLEEQPNGSCGTSNSIEKNNDAGDKKNFKIDRDLDPGTYYIAVTNSNKSLGSYTLHLTCLTDQGEDCDNADEIDCNSTISGSTISWSEDRDYYRINLPTDYPSLVEIYTTGDTDTYGYLLSSTEGCNNLNDRRDYDQDDGDDLNFKIEEQELAPLPAGEFYYIRVRRTWHKGLTYPLEYNLHVKCRKAPRIITATAGPDGTISPAGNPAGNVEVDVGDDQTFTFSADQYYAIKEIIVDGAPLVIDPLDPMPTEYTFKNITENHTIHVNFEVQKDCEPPCVDEPTAQNEECEPKDQSVDSGSWQFIGSYDFVQGSGAYITITRIDGTHQKSTLADAVRFVNVQTGAEIIVDNKDPGYSESGLWKNSNSDNMYDGDARYTSQDGASATFRPALPDRGVYMVFAWWNSYNQRDQSAPYCVYDHVGRAPLIEVNSGDHGEVDPDGSQTDGKVTVVPGGDKTFTITPNTGYFIANNQVIVDGVTYYDPATATLTDGSIMTFGISGRNGTLQFTGVAADHVINVSFDDFGNTCDNAKNVSCGYNSIATIDFNGDADYYQLTIDENTYPNGQTVVIYTEGDTDTFGELIQAGECADCDNCLIPLDSDDDSGTSQNFRIERVLLPADYYIKVRHSNSQDGGAYRLRVSCSAPPSPILITVKINNTDYGNVTIPGHPFSDNEVSVPFGSDITFSLNPELTYCVEQVIIIPTVGDPIFLGRVTSYSDPYVDESYIMEVVFTDCIHVEDKDGDGYTVGEGDCSDDPALDPNAAEIHPGAPEECDNGIDEDCNGVDLRCSLLSGCVDISDMPLAVQMITAPPLLMFLLDDSGSMDWSILSSEGSSGAFRYSGTNYYYIFDDPHGDNNYTNYPILDENARKAWQSQYGGSLINANGTTVYPNAMYYNPEVTYTPWPTYTGAYPVLGDAHTDHPLSDPMDSDTLFDIDKDDDGLHTGLDDVFCTLSQGAGERITIRREKNDGSSTSADAVALVRVDKWQDGVAIEDQTDVIIVDDKDSQFTTSGSWKNSSAEDFYGSTSLYSSDTGAEATWVLNVPSGQYYVFITSSKKDEKTHTGNTVWGYWDTSKKPYAWKSENIRNRAQHAPVTVFSNGGYSSDKLEFTINQQWIKPKNIPEFENADTVDWNDRWKTYWQSYWNGGKNNDGSNKTDAEAGWTGQDPIIYAPDYWNGLDWMPLGDPIGSAPGKVFTFQGVTPVEHKVVNAHYYTQDNSGEKWLVEIKKYKNDDPNTNTDESLMLDPHIDYYLFDDGDNNDYVHSNELLLKNINDVPIEIKTYTEKPDPDNTATWLTKELTYDYARQNFANWYSFYRRRELTAKAAVGRVVAETKNIMIGLETIHSRSQTPVVAINVEDMTDMTDSFLDELYHIYSSSGTPLRQGVERIGKYYHANDGSNPSGLGTSPFWPVEDGGECQHAFVIAMTDGYYNGSAPSVGNADNDNTDDDNIGNFEYQTKIIDGTPTDVPYGDSYSNTLADVAMHYYERDLVEDLEDKVNSRGIDKANHQHMVTYGITFGVSGTLPLPLMSSDAYENCPPDCGWPKPQSNNPTAVDDLVHAAVNGRGEFMSAKKPEQLVEVLKDLLASLETSSGSGASVTTNTAQLQEGTMLFQGRYSSDGWAGNVIAYELDTATRKIKDPDGKWNAAEELGKQDATSTNPPDQGGRIIITHDGEKGRPFRINPANYNWPDPADPTIVFQDNPFFLSEAQQKSLHISSTTEAEKVLNYTRGDHSNEQDQGGLFRNRIPISDNNTELNKLGDIVSSETLNYHHESGDVLYIGSNDGMLHAFDSATGLELWAYLPNLVLPNLYELKDPNYGHYFFVDGDHYARNIADPDNPFILLAGSFRKGAKGIYCLNITNPRPDSEKNAASLIPLWEYPAAGTAPQAGMLKVRYGIEEDDPDKTWHGTKFNCNVEVTGKNSGAKATIALMGDQKRVLTLFNIEPGPDGDLFFEDEEIAGGGGNAKVSKTLYSMMPDPDIGYSYSKPQINKTQAGWVIIFGNGYDSLRGHAVLYIIQLDSNGKIVTDLDDKLSIRKIDTDPKGVMASCMEDNRQCNGLSTPVMVDHDNDGIDDFAYAGDLKGNLWKFDLRDSDINNWKVAYWDSVDADQPRPLFQAVNANGMEQPITTKPEVAQPCDQTKKGYVVMFGTGRYLGETDFSDKTIQSVYAIWDWQQEWEKFVSAEEASKYYYGKLNPSRDAVQANCTAKADVATQGDGRLCPSDITSSRTLSNTYLPRDVRMVQQTLSNETQEIEVLQTDGTYAMEEKTFSIATNYQVNWYSPDLDPTNTDQADTSGCHVGWYYDLVTREAGDCSNAVAEGARVTANSTIRSGLVYLPATIPTDKPCEAGGSSALPALDICDGGRNDEPIFDINGDGIIDDNDLINIGTEDNRIMVPPSGLHFNSLIFTPTFISAAGTDIIVIGTAKGDILMPPGKASPTGIYFWKERE